MRTGINSLNPDAEWLLFNDNYTLRRPLDASRWFIADEIGLKGGWLGWVSITDHAKADPLEAKPSVTPASLGPNMWMAFLKLSTAPDERILQYARKYGVLHICEHGLPSEHSWQSRPGLPPSDASGCRSLGEHMEWRGSISVAKGCEPIAVWRHFARQAAALVNIAAELHHGRPGRIDDWRAVGEWTGKLVNLETGDVQEPDSPQLGSAGAEENWSSLSLDAQEFRIERIVTDWLRWGAVTPSFTWSHDGPRVLLGGSGLFGALAVQLMLTVSRVEGLAICSGCGKPYIPKKQPAASRRRYCDECRNSGVPLRDAARDSYQRKKDKGGIANG